MPLESPWNWQQDDWPKFRYAAAVLAPMEADFLRQSGIFIGAVRHMAEGERDQIIVDLMSDEAFSSSEIEGEILNRESLQSSIRRNLGLTTDNRRIPPAEQGISEMMVDLFRNFNEPLSDKVLFRWHEMLMNGRRDLKSIGGYRKGGDPMQIVSGPLHDPKVHFEAPPSSSVRTEMTRFVTWFNETSPSGINPLPALARAGMAHWHFVSIHPFEDGNGRIARAISEKALSQGLHQPVLLALSRVIHGKRKAYYDVLESGNRNSEISEWLLYFAQTVLDGQDLAQRTVDFLIGKTKFFDRLRNHLNPRQEKALLRMFREGPGGFQGGLSAEKYIRLTGASRATASRDLQDLVRKNAFTRTGERKGTRYFLNLPG